MKSLFIIINDWAINFSGHKSKFICFGTQRNDKTEFVLKGKVLELDPYSKHLGINFNYRLDFSKFILDKFSSVSKAFFSLNSCGLRPYGVNPYLQSFMYKTFCLSKMLYGLEFMNINDSTLNNLNLLQNSLIKYMLGVKKYSHVSDVYRVLGILKMEDLYIFCKLSFLKNLKKNPACLHIFNNLIENERMISKNSKSFINDIKKITILFNTNYYDLRDNIEKFIENFLNNLKYVDMDNLKEFTIKSCLDNYNSSGMNEVLNLTINYH
jgi:hypothetical protein